MPVPGVSLCPFLAREVPLRANWTCRAPPSLFSSSSVLNGHLSVPPSCSHLSKNLIRPNLSPKLEASSGQRNLWGNFLKKFRQCLRIRGELDEIIGKNAQIPREKEEGGDWMNSQSGNYQFVYRWPTDCCSRFCEGVLSFSPITVLGNALLRGWEVGRFQPRKQFE